MKVKVLGCSGGVNQNVATTSFLVDEDILIDAGSGVCTLPLKEMRRIRHIFITHSHLDHMAAIPLLADTLFDDLIGNPFVVHALPETIEALNDHIPGQHRRQRFELLPRLKGLEKDLHQSVASDTKTPQVIVIQTKVVRYRLRYTCLCDTSRTQCQIALKTASRQHALKVTGSIDQHARADFAVS